MPDRWRTYTSGIVDKDMLQTIVICVLVLAALVFVGVLVYLIRLDVKDEADNLRKAGRTDRREKDR